jgi:hypothetical protein
MNEYRLKTAGPHCDPAEDFEGFQSLLRGEEDVILLVGPFFLPVYFRLLVYPW